MFVVQFVFKVPVLLFPFADLSFLSRRTGQTLSLSVSFMRILIVFGLRGRVRINCVEDSLCNIYFWVILSMSQSLDFLQAGVEVGCNSNLTAQALALRQI